MAFKIKINDFVIINECDAPCGNHVAIVEKIKDGTVYAKYISKKVDMINCCGPIENCTNIKDFGVEIEFGYKKYLAKHASESTATYHDGKRRYWQDTAEIWRELRYQPGDDYELLKQKVGIADDILTIVGKIKEGKEISSIKSKFEMAIGSYLDHWRVSGYEYEMQIERGEISLNHGGYINRTHEIYDSLTPLMACSSIKLRVKKVYEGLSLQERVLLEGSTLRDISMMNVNGAITSVDIDISFTGSGVSIVLNEWMTKEKLIGANVILPLTAAE